MTKRAHIRFSLAAWIGLVFMAGLSFPQNQQADLKGKMKDLNYNNPSVTFTFIEDVKQIVWACRAGGRNGEKPYGTPRVMEEGGWDQDVLKPGTITIHGTLSTQDKTLLVMTITTNSSELPTAHDPNKDAPPFTCSLAKAK